MAIHIEQINVENAGPISELQLNLGPFNLIYGRNEQGKTFVVEFVIRCLFNNLSGWTLRDSDCRGKLVLSGLAEAPRDFLPSSRHKLEHYLLESEPGMPEQISRLLVIKGAELSFERTRQPGISRAVLKQLLSGHGVLDDIQKNISKTVRKANLEDGHIVGHRYGEVRTRENLADALSAIDALFEEIERTYSGGERRTLENRIEQLDEAITRQEIARRYEAYKIHEQIEKREKRLQQLPAEELEQLNEDFRRLQEAQNRIRRQQEKLTALAQASRHYGWLEEAIALYETRGEQGRTSLTPLYPAAILGALLLAVLSSFLQFPLGTFVLVLIAAVIGWFMLRRYRSALEHAVDIEEIKKLEAEFQDRFGRKLSGLPQMKTMKKSMEEAYHGANTLRSDLQDEEETVSQIGDQITSRLQRLTGQSIAEKNWSKAISKLNRLREELQQEVNRQNVALATLGVAPDDYHVEPAPVEYSQETVRTLRGDLEQAQAELRAKTDELRTLKQRISEKTVDEITLEWETLIHNLQRKRQEIAAEYRAVTAQIIAGILVNGQLEAIREQEEEKIREKLGSDVVCGPVFDITKRYSGMAYEDGSVFVTDNYGRFPLADLSTGAREQVLLGLRIGFVAHLLRQSRLFLLLDDAFQHADWQRRRWLLDQVVALAKDGWQIVYFTMDDHIRDLFNAAGQTHFPEDYCYHELGG